MHTSRQRLDVQRQRVLAVDAVAHAAQQREVAQTLLGRRTGHGPIVPRGARTEVRDNGIVIVQLIVTAVVAVLIVAVVRFEWMCLSVLAHADDRDLRYLTRPGWIAVILIVIPLGGIAFLYTGRRS